MTWPLKNFTAVALAVCLGPLGLIQEHFHILIINYMSVPHQQKHQSSDNCLKLRYPLQYSIYGTVGGFSRIDGEWNDKYLTG